MRLGYSLLGFLMGCLLTVQAAQTKARLLLDHSSATPGQTVMATVELKMPGKWHTYWVNAGDSGLATEIQWTLPEGWKAGEIQWPVPEKVVIEGLSTYAYHHEALLLVPITLPPNAASAEHVLKAAVSWLECESVCLPAKAALTTKLTVGSASIASNDLETFAKAKSKLPTKLEPAAASARWLGPAKGDLRTLSIEWSGAGEKPDFFPYASEGFEVQGDTILTNAAAAKVTLHKTVKKRTAWPTSLNGLLVSQSGSEHKGFEVALPLTDNNPAGAQAGVSTGTTASPGAATKAPQSLLVMLAFAFLGGMILNIMPCVLPVIALKILGFVHQSQADPKRVRQLGLLYTLGVIVSFLLLAAMVIGVKSAGNAANWGMQFQNPQFVVGITILVTLVALNLFGVFEVILGGGAMGAAGNLASKEGNAGAFFNGVLATILATPCTAPFLGIALGFAFTQSAATILLIFITVALGLSAPYLALSWYPKWLKLLPKPGAWMEHFKVGMGFPMLGTAIWLFTIAVTHFGPGSTLWLALLLLLVSFAAWVYGQFGQRGRKHRGFATAFALGLLIVSYLYILEGKLKWRASPEFAGSNVAAPAQDGGIAWERWSSARVAELRAQERPILVDFTADWCLICQANKKRAIETPKVIAAIKALGVVPLLGDHTRKDPLITAELAKFERAGVPLVIVYPADKSLEPIVLPEWLTESIVMEALETAWKSSVPKMTAQ